MNSTLESMKALSVCPFSGNAEGERKKEEEKEIPQNMSSEPWNLAR